MTVERHSHYLPPSTDTRLGTNSNSMVPAKPNYSSLTKGREGIDRVSLKGNDGLVSVGGIRSTPEALAAAGLLQVDNLSRDVRLPTAHGAELSDEGRAANSSKRIAEQQGSREASADQQLFNQHNAALDMIENSMSREHFGALVTAGLDMDEDAINFIESVSPAIIDGYIEVATRLCRENGLFSLDALSVILSDDDQRSARAALIKGDHTRFAAFIHQALNQARSVVVQDDFIDQLEECGAHVVNGNLIYEGRNLGDVADCVL